MVGCAHKPTCVWEEPLRAKRRLCMRVVGCGGAHCGGTVQECTLDLLPARLISLKSQIPLPYGW